MKIRLFSGPGTRRWPRFSISNVPSIIGIKSAAGSRISVVDISRGGALLLTPRLLVPGTRVRLKVETSKGSIPVAGLVLRSSNFSLEDRVQYQTAVAFNRLLQIPDDRRQQTEDISRNVANYPEGDFSTIEGFLAIDFCREQEAAMPEMLRLNDW